MMASSYLKQTIVTVLCVLGIPTYLSAPKPISIHLGGSSSITVSANRANLALRLYAEGPKQDRVADELRKTADYILGVMRPLQQVSIPPVDPQNNFTGSIDEYEPSIVDLSVTTFRTHSWLKYGTSIINRDTQQYESSMEIEAEFRDFDALGLLLAQVSKQPAITVRSLTWRLDDITKKRLFSQCRTEAMVDALDKVRAYVRPLGMDKVRATKLNEHQIRSREMVHADTRNFGYRGDYADDLVLHDEFDDYRASRSSSRTESPPEAFGLEPRSLEIRAEIEGEFCAWRTGLEAWFRRGGV
jgi:hypothetical protein